MLTKLFALFFIFCAVLIIVCWDENIEIWTLFLGDRLGRLLYNFNIWVNNKFIDFWK